MTAARASAPLAAVVLALVAAAGSLAPDGSARATDAADIVVAQTASSDELLVGQTLTLTVTVTNNGPDPASKVTVRVALAGPQATIASATATAGQPCSIGTTARRARCVVGTLPAGQQAKVTVTVDAASSGLLTATASAAGHQADPDATNSEATSQTRIRETAAPVQLTLASDALTMPLAPRPDFRLAWKAIDTGSGVAGYDIRYRAASWSRPFGPFVAWRTRSHDTHGIFLGKPGWSYCFQLRATDRDGNASKWTPERCASVPLPPQAARSRGWTFGATSGHANASGATLLLPQVLAKRIDLLVVRCPRCGTLRVLWSGRPVAVVKLAAAVRSRVLLSVASWPSVRRGSLRLQVVSAKGTVTVVGLGILKH